MSSAAHYLGVSMASSRRKLMVFRLAAFALATVYGFSECVALLRSRFVSHSAR
jgi:hypothetical protein